MARSALVPLRINDRGGVDMTPADDGGRRCLQQVVVARLTPGSTLHPFNLQEGRVTAGRAYDPAGMRQATVIRGQVTKSFAELEAQGRARLVDVQVRRVADDGRRVVNITWQNLELGGEPGSITAEV